jgi:mRNA-degrading endonuclease RelE of RelBE toxin-antitoxin system
MGKHIAVEYTPEFKRNLKRLAKKYPHIRSDVEPVIKKLELGELPGDKIPGTGYVLFKTRIKNRDITKGKSGGYRMIYYLKKADTFILVTIYSKSDQADISSDQLRRIILEVEHSAN